MFAVAYLLPHSSHFYSWLKRKQWDQGTTDQQSTLWATSSLDFSNFESHHCRGLWVFMCVFGVWRERHALAFILFSSALYPFFTFLMPLKSTFEFSFSFSPVNLIPTTPIVEEQPFQAADRGVGSALGKSRKRVFPVPHTEEPDPISEAYGYCNTPNRTEQAWEGEACILTNKIFRI